jgi:hypothetical protein
VGGFVSTFVGLAVVEIKVGSSLPGLGTGSEVRAVGVALGCNVGDCE